MPERHYLLIIQSESRQQECRIDNQQQFMVTAAKGFSKRMHAAVYAAAPINNTSQMMTIRTAVILVGKMVLRKRR